MKKNNQCANCHYYTMVPRNARAILCFLSVTVVGLPLCLILIGFIMVPIGIVGMFLSWLLLKGEYCTNCGFTIKYSQPKPARGKDASENY